MTHTFNVHECSKALSGSDRWFAPQGTPGQKIRNLPQNVLCFNTSPKGLTLVHQKSVFTSISSFTPASGNQQSYIVFLIEILYI